MIMLCPICGEEFMPRLIFCPTCGCDLVSSSVLPVGDSEEKRGPVRYVELCRPGAYPLAMLVKQMLEQNGIAVMMQGGHSLSMLPHLAFGGELRLLVDAEQYEYALSLYRAYFESDEDDFVPEE